MTLERGTLLHKRYRIVEILGQGGMGSVYRAVDENLGVDVAVKENLFTTDEYARQFRLEAVILASLRHPNLPRVSDHFAIGDQGQYLIMDFIEGEDLRQRMERMGTITEDDAVMVGAAMCDALTYLHTRKPSILHRDIKPGNVKITPEGNIYLVDFGLAKLVQGSQATTTGARAMTPGYSPPEQYGTARTDPRTDIYSLGATLYAALTGMIPEDGLARAMDNAQLTPLRKRNPKVSKRLSAAVEKAMAVDPADRFQNAEDFKKALLNARSRTERATGDFTVSPPPTGPQGLAAVSAQAKPNSQPRGNTPLPSFAPEEQKVFIPPQKRRRRSALPLIILLAALMAVAGLFVLYPNPMYAQVEQSLPPQMAAFVPTLRVMLSIPAVDPLLNPTPISKATSTSNALTVSTVLPSQAAATATLKPTATATSLPTSTPTTVPTAASTSVPLLGGGNSGEIAFASNRSGIPQIYVSNLMGTEAQVITKMEDGACEPAWSPDGKRIAFISPCQKPHDISQPPPTDTSIWIANADGSEAQELMPGSKGDSEPAWAPDGNRIAFTHMSEGHALIYVWDIAEGQTPTLITPASADFDIARQPSWSAAGNQILFAKRRFGAYQIWVGTDTGKGDEQQIMISGNTLWDYLPVFSPDGKNVLFSERPAIGPVYPHLWEMSVEYEKRGASAGAAQIRLPQPVENVHFSPDGRWYVFQVPNARYITDIYYATIEGTNWTQLTADPSSDFDPAWRP